MRRGFRHPAIGLAILVLLTASLASGEFGFEQPSGTPPFGVAVSTDAQGVKLTGVLFIEFYNIVRQPDGSIPADARVLLRLRHPNKGLKTAFTEAFAAEGVDLTRLGATQLLILGKLRPEILQKFFDNDLSLQITLKNMDEVVARDVVTALAFGRPSRMVLADLVLAVSQP